MVGVKLASPHFTLIALHIEAALPGFGDSDDSGRAGNYRARGGCAGCGQRRACGDSASHGGGIDDAVRIDGDGTNFRKRGIEQDGGLLRRRNFVENAVGIGAGEQATVRAGS